MNPRIVAIRAGVQRGRIEFRQTATSPGEILGWLWMPLIALVVMYVLSDTAVPGTDFSLGSQAVPGILAMNVVFSALLGLAAVLTMDRGDGTLLRAKATPNGMLGYLTGRVLSRAALSVLMLLIVLIPSAFIFEGLQLGSAVAWLRLAWVLALGLVATLPVGAVLGAVFSGPQGLSLVSFLVMGLSAISGVFYPIAALPEWLQWIAQVFPLYWLGLGMRSALLPEAVVVAEIGESWRTVEMIGVLGVWVVIGFTLAPMVLRRMARRESGSNLEARRQRAMSSMG
ncbi:ABC transporter permease [Sinosporangium siamense]|uniref:Transport permease protein n=1 Tax=Sinosporangium siamense TaxID=1367973 RepID=A0A919RMP1_9ACTN|nr:ABC transporter permease [Sinosporangium siamense]GII96383.1 transport permease protein [Sinosporangium siamense]